MGPASHASERLLVSVLLQLIVMIAAARVCNRVARRLGQPGVIGEIVAGLLLGPSLFGWFCPHRFASLFSQATSGPITMISQVGLILLMFQIGSGFEFSRLNAGRERSSVVLIAVLSVGLPFGLGVWLGTASAAALAPQAPTIPYSLFCGVALAITAVPILGRILVEFRLDREPVGLVAISAAALNDVLGWLLLGAVASYAADGLSPIALIERALALGLFAVVWRYLLHPLSRRLLAVWPVEPDGQIPPDLLAIVLCLMFALALCTWRIGIFSIFGGFAAGLLFHHDAAFVAAWQRQVGRFVLVFFLPVFFTYTGLHTDLLGLGRADLGWLALVLATAIGGKLTAGFLAGRLAGFDAPNAAILATLMNTRGLMELIVLNAGRELGVLPPKMFTMLVVMAVVTTMMTGPLLRVLLPWIGHSATRLAEA
nr:cation:proton antiporter [uncultured Lichenicoccus sp.]